MTIDWTPYRDYIIALHKEGKSLPEIRRLVSHKSNRFNPSERSWRTKLKEWGCTTGPTVTSRRSHRQPSDDARAAPAATTTSISSREASPDMPSASRYGSLIERSPQAGSTARNNVEAQTTDIAIFPGRSQSAQPPIATTDIRTVATNDTDGMSPLSSDDAITITTEDMILWPNNNRAAYPTSDKTAPIDLNADVPSERSHSIPCDWKAMLPLSYTRPPISDAYEEFDLPGLDVGSFDESFALHSALQQGKEDLVNEILAVGTNPNLKTPEGFTPLHIAVRAGASPSSIDNLIRFGADASVTDARGNLPLHWAISWNWAVASKLFGSTFDAGSTLNQDWASPLQLAFKSYRLGTCTLESLDLVWSETREKTYAHGITAPQRHLLKSMCRNHDTSTQRGRTAWWKSMISCSSKTQPLDILGKMQIKCYRERYLAAFPNSDVLLCESLLRELPPLSNSNSQMSQLLDLGDSIVSIGLENHLEISSSKDTFDRILDLLIQGGCSEFWRDHPERIIWWMDQIVYRSCENHPCACDKFHVARAVCKSSGKSLLMKAIESFPPSNHTTGLHIASAFIKHGSDAFQKECNGQVPLLAAAERREERLVGLMLRRDLKYKGFQRRVISGASGHLDGRFFWPAWEESKATDDWHNAVVLVEPASLYCVPGVSAKARTVLSKAAMGVILRGLREDLSSWHWKHRDDKEAKRAQLAATIDYCRKHEVESGDWIYGELVNVS